MSAVRGPRSAVRGRSHRGSTLRWPRGLTCPGGGERADPADRKRSLWYLDTSAVSIPVGLQCAVAIALPLIVGISTGHDRAAGWGAVGAFLTDMAMDQPDHEFRARIVSHEGRKLRVTGECR